MTQRADYKTRFQSQGIGTKSKQQPISVLYPQDVDKILRALPNRSTFIRDAVISKLREEGLLPLATNNN